MSLGGIIYSLIQSARVRGFAGEPIPTVFHSLESDGTRFLRGQLVLVSAGPGAGKSALTLTLVVKSGASCLYFSADSDAFVQLSRALSIITGEPLEDTYQAVRDNTLTHYESALSRVPVRFNFDANPSLEDIENNVEAFLEIYGEYPQIIVVDNITNCRTGGANDEDPFSGLESLMDYLHTMARATGSCVFGLHHVTGGYNNSDRPIPLTGVKGQIARVPEMVLTLHKPTPDHICVSKVKDRGGKVDTSGWTFTSLGFDGSRMQITDIPISHVPNLTWDQNNLWS